MSLYDEESNDFEVVQGDTINIPFDFTDTDGNEVDITAWQIKFSVRDPITNDLVTAMSKYHNTGGADENDGIYYSIDTNTPANLVPFLTGTNQVIIVLSYTDTGIDEGVYPYDLEITRSDSPVKKTIKGNLIVTKEVTASV